MNDVERRLDKLEDELGSDESDKINFLTVFTTEQDKQHRPPGLYWPDRPGCHAAELVFDPALGEAKLPRKYMSDHCVVIRFGLLEVPPPIDDTPDDS